MRVLRGARDRVLFALPDARSHRLLTFGWDRTARVFELPGGTLVQELPHPGADILGGAIAPDGSRVLTVIHRLGLLWTVGAREPVLLDTDSEGSPVPSTTETIFRESRFAPGGERFSFSPQHGTRAWVVRTDAPLERVALDGHGDIVTSAVMSRDGSIVATACQDGIARVFDSRTGREVHRSPPYGAPVLRVEVARDAGALVLAYDDGTARVEPLDERRAARLDAAGRTIRYATFSPRADRVAVTFRGPGVGTFDAADGTAIGVCDLQGSAARHVAFSPDGRWIAAACEDGATRVFDARTRRPRVVHRAHRGGVNHVSFLPGHPVRVATASDDGTVRVWPIDPRPAARRVLDRGR